MLRLSVSLLHYIFTTNTPYLPYFIPFSDVMDGSFETWRINFFFPKYALVETAIYSYPMHRGMPYVNRHQKLALESEIQNLGSGQTWIFL